MQKANRRYSAEITAVGMYVPEKVLDNKYFESIVDTNDEWIVTRTGIRERRKLEVGATSDLAVKAAEDLFKTTDVKPEDIDVIGSFTWYSTGAQGNLDTCIPIIPELDPVPCALPS